MEDFNPEEIDEITGFDGDDEDTDSPNLGDEFDLDSEDEEETDDEFDLGNDDEELD